MIPVLGSPPPPPHTQTVRIRQVCVVGEAATEIVRVAAKSSKSGGKAWLGLSPKSCELDANSLKKRLANGANREACGRPCRARGRPPKLAKLTREVKHEIHEI